MNFYKYFILMSTSFQEFNTHDTKSINFFEIQVDSRLAKRLKSSTFVSGFNMMQETM
jgi:hypothetical protein